MRKISITNLAWAHENDEDAYQLMEELGFTFLEIAPSRLWKAPQSVTGIEASRLLRKLSEHKITPVAFQAILFGRPDLTIFENKNSRKKTFEYLQRIIDLGEKLGVQAIIFGSPKNKRRGRIPKNKAMSIAVDFFGPLGEYAINKEISFCIEATPEVYGADFILTTKEAIELVRASNSKGLRLNLDLGGVKTEGGEVISNLEKALPFAGHFHVSEPGLRMIELERQFHIQVASRVNASSYQGAISIEMLSERKYNPENIEKVLQFVKRTYGNV